MSDKKILTVFGATGLQGGSILDVILARPALSSKYAIRAVTRDTTSEKSQALAAKGVELVRADLDDLASVTAAVQNSYGVFGVTDFWSHLSKDREIRQGKNIFEASKSAGIKHLVFSALPNVSKLSQGRHTQVEHFDGKAEVAEHIEANKGDMWASYYMPAMYIDFLKNLVHPVDGVPTLSLPFPDENIPWPLVAPRRDGGKYVVGLFEAGREADGAHVQGISTWTSPRKFVDQLGESLGREVRYQPVSGEAFGRNFPEAIRADLVDMMLWIGEDSYYGAGSPAKQAESERFLVEDADLLDVPGFIREAQPWKV
ncbi:NAD(P)-binding protein [Dissoconium aciculare CBS 342.82]|uniref:NAD(P)-binding protein n=1 Tax=Dissoconium aciculare CBS 342.82 TaxID=1314786 RepID=A0A6J3LUE4_9PEZI|nr:NAD(P)-binding protein [Dissoconium aciculare CBS 342.82]KAF1819405.1 NAD(P)-binding protein [Dissoconium aciculare CBS 342.82]